MQIIQDFSALHAIPELDRSLPKTVSYVKKQLAPLKCRVLSWTEGSVCAFFNFGKPRTVAFRADMDALPFPDGALHACGHDGHTAILLELARRLQRQTGLPHNVLLIFQPAEETTGGGEELCRTGLLEHCKVCCIFGLHLWPGLEKGQIFSRPGYLMSRSCGVQVHFTGRSRHIAQPEKGEDALAACFDFYRLAMRIKEKQPHLLKFGALQAGTAGNVVCANADLQGSLRCFQEQVYSRLCQKLRMICTAVSKTHHCGAEILFSTGYPAVRNCPELYKKLQQCGNVKYVPHPFWTADDFSSYQQRVPGVYALLGIGDTPPLHSKDFSFDTDVLLKGADFFTHISRTNLIG